MQVSDFYSKFSHFASAVIDSRKVQPGDLFFAFSGTSFNAATAAQDAVRNGALAAFVEDVQYAAPDDRIFYVGDTLSFLREFAKIHRKQLSIPVIGLTGSNGKTTTKELMHAALSKKFETQYTRGNLNNHIGVPLTTLSIKPQHQVAIVEMGANHQGEIALLCEIAQPTLGYITNFGLAHLEGFGGPEGVVKGKTELYRYLQNQGGEILVNGKDARQMELTRDEESRIVFNGKDSTYTFDQVEFNHQIGVAYRQKKAITHLAGSYNFDNICAAVTLGLHLGVEWELIAAGVQNYMPTNMRSQVITVGNQTLILDAYNANPSSMTAAVDNLAKFGGKKLAVLGDMLELGTYSAEKHLAILDHCKKAGIDEIITVGTAFQDAAQGHSVRSFDTVDHCRPEFDRIRGSFDVILIKGSRGIALEKLIQ